MNNRRTDNWKVLSLFVLIGCAVPADVQAQSLTIEQEEVQVPIDVISGALGYLDIPPAPRLVEGGIIYQQDRINPNIPLPVIPDPEPEMGFSMENAGEPLTVVGTFGGGSASSVIGSVEVSRFGDGPKFRFSYEQDRSDGGWDLSPGTGYLVQSNALETEILLNGEEKGLEGSVAFDNRQTGLQGKSQYYSADVRSVDGTVEGYFSPSESLRFTGGLFSRDYRRVLTVTDSSEDAPVLARTEVSPFLAMELTFPRVTLDTRVDYRGNWYSGFEADATHRAALSLMGEIVLRPGTLLSFSTEAGYIGGYGPVFPASIVLEGDVSPSFFLSAEANYSVDLTGFDDFWYKTPTIDPGTVADRLSTPEEDMGGEVTAEWRIVPERFLLTGNLSYTYRSSVWDVDDFDSVTKLTPVRVEDRRELASTIQTRIIDGPWDGELFWTQRWMDRGTMDAAVEGGLTLSYTSDRFRLYLDTLLPYFDTLDVPLLGVRSEYVIAPSAYISAFIEDALGPLLQTKRTVYGDFVDVSNPFASRGTRIGATVSVRL